MSRRTVPEKAVGGGKGSPEMDKYSTEAILGSHSFDKLDSILRVEGLSNGSHAGERIVDASRISREHPKLARLLSQTWGVALEDLASFSYPYKYDPNEDSVLGYLRGVSKIPDATHIGVTRPGHTEPRANPNKRADVETLLSNIGSDLTVNFPPVRPSVARRAIPTKLVRNVATADFDTDFDVSPSTKASSPSRRSVRASQSRPNKSSGGHDGADPDEDQGHGGPPEEPQEDEENDTLGETGGSGHTRQKEKKVEKAPPPPPASSVNFKGCCHDFPGVLNECAREVEDSELPFVPFLSEDIANTIRTECRLLGELRWKGSTQQIEARKQNAIHPNLFSRFVILKKHLMTNSCVSPVYFIRLGSVHPERQVKLAVGQHVCLRLYGSWNRWAQRLYTPIYAHGSTIELLVKIQPEGEVTPRMELLQPGDSVQLRGPLGVDILPLVHSGTDPAASAITPRPDRPLRARSPFRPWRQFVMVCAGTGITPMVQLLQYVLIHWNLPKRDRPSVIRRLPREDHPSGLEKAFERMILSDPMPRACPVKDVSREDGELPVFHEQASGEQYDECIEDTPMQSCSWDAADLGYHTSIVLLTVNDTEEDVILRKEFTALEHLYRTLCVRHYVSYVKKEAKAARPSSKPHTPMPEERVEARMQQMNDYQYQPLSSKVMEETVQLLTARSGQPGVTDPNLDRMFICGPKSFQNYALQVLGTCGATVNPECVWML